MKNVKLHIVEASLVPASFPGKREKAIDQKKYQGGIESAVEYLIERRKRPNTFRAENDPLKHIPDDQFTNPKAFQARLDRLIKHLNAVGRETQKLMFDFHYGRLDPFGSAAKLIDAARDKTLLALVHVLDAKKCTVSPRRTRLLDEQRSAVRLAEGIYGANQPRKVRQVAKEIMRGARIKEPTDRAITQWLKEFRRQNGK
jgi:hypothetical protein